MSAHLQRIIIACFFFNSCICPLTNETTEAVNWNSIFNYTGIVQWISSFNDNFTLGNDGFINNASDNANPNGNPYPSPHSALSATPQYKHSLGSSKTRSIAEDNTSATSKVPYVTSSSSSAVPRVFRNNESHAKTNNATTDNMVTTQPMLYFNSPVVSIKDDDYSDNIILSVIFILGTSVISGFAYYIYKTPIKVKSNSLIDLENDLNNLQMKFPGFVPKLEYDTQNNTYEFTMATADNLYVNNSNLDEKRPAYKNSGQDQNNMLDINTSTKLNVYNSLHYPPNSANRYPDGTMSYSTLRKDS